MLTCWSRLFWQDTSHHKVAILLFHGGDLVRWYLLTHFKGFLVFYPSKSSQNKAQHECLFIIDAIKNELWLSTMYFIGNIWLTLQQGLNGNGSNHQNIQIPALEQAPQLYSSIANLEMFGSDQFSGTGYYKGSKVALKYIKKDYLQVTREILLEFNYVSY